MLPTDIVLRVSWGRSSWNGNGGFGPDRSQDAKLVPWFAPPCLAIPIEEVIAAFIGIVTDSPETFRESVFVLGVIVQSGYEGLERMQDLTESKSDQRLGIRGGGVR